MRATDNGSSISHLTRPAAADHRLSHRLEAAAVGGGGRRQSRVISQNYAKVHNIAKQIDKEQHADLIFSSQAQSVPTFSSQI